jgi:hypothetical protein
MDIILGTKNMRSMYRAGSLMTAAKEISKYTLDILAVQEVAPSRRIYIFLWKGE